MSVPSWEFLRVDYRVDDRVGSFQEFEQDEDQIPKQAGQLVPESVRMIGGKENPLFWSGTEIPACLALLSTGNAILPAKVITNAPYMNREVAKRLRIQGEPHDFSFEPTQHFPGRAGEYVSRYAGTVDHRLAEASGHGGSLVLRHQVMVECDSGEQSFRVTNFDFPTGSMSNVFADLFGNSTRVRSDYGRG